MSDQRRPSGVGLALGVVLLVVSGVVLLWALVLFLSAISSDASDPHGYAAIFSAFFGIVATPVLLSAVLMVFGRHPWVRLVVSLLIALLAVAIGLLLVVSALETRSTVGVNLPLLAPGALLLLGGTGLAVWRTVESLSGRRRQGAAAPGPPPAPGPAPRAPVDGPGPWGP